MRLLGQFQTLYIFIIVFFTKRFYTHQKHQKHQKHNDATKQKHKTLQANSKGMVVPPHQ